MTTATRQRLHFEEDPLTPGVLLTGLSSEKARLKLASSKALRNLSEHAPERVYPFFDIFAGLLGHENNIIKWNAILTLAHLARADGDGKIDILLDRYLEPITGPVMITAANTIKGAALIARQKPHLAERIAKCILRVEKATYATPECRNVAIGHALTALGSFLFLLEDVRPAIRFAVRQTHNPRPATAAKARRLASNYS